MKDLIVKITSDAGADGRRLTLADDDVDEDVVEHLEVLDPDHPILQRFQATLTELLLAEDHKLDLQILEVVRPPSIAYQNQTNHLFLLSS